MRILPSRLGPKLYLSLLAFMLVLSATLAAVLLLGFDQTKTAATDSSKEGLVRQSRDTLRALSEQQAGFGEAQLEATAGSAQLAARYLTDARIAGSAVPWDSARLTPGSGGQLYDPRPDRITDVRIPSTVPLDADVERDLRDSASLDALFPTLLASFQAPTRSANFDAVAIYFDSTHGVTRYYPPIGIANRQAADQVTTAVILQAGPRANPGRATIWTAPYRDQTGKGLIITARAPVYEGDEFRGVMSVDLSLAKLIAQVDLVKPTPGGFSFYIDRDGNLLQSANASVVQAAIDDPGNSVFAGALQNMRQGNSGADRLTLGGREVFVAYAPLSGVGGSFALVAPIDEITQESQSVAASISSQANRAVAFTLLAMLAIFALALAATAWLTNRSLLRPIGTLVGATRAVAAGNLNATIPVESKSELGMLAGSFNNMTIELRQRRDRLREEVEERERAQNELRALFEAMNDVVVVIDREGRFLSVAPTKSWLTPMTQRLLGRSVAEAGVPSEQVAGFQSAIDRALKTSEPQELEYVLRVGDADARIEATVSPMTDDSVIWVARDVTERKRAEERLRASESLADVLFDRMPMGIGVFDLNARLLRRNPTWGKFIDLYTPGAGARAQPGASIYELAPKGEATLRPVFERVFAGETVVQEQVELRQGGAVSYWDAVFAPLVEQGTVAGLISVVSDATERKRATEQLLEKEEQYRSVFQTTTDGMTISNLDGEIIEANRAAYEMHGYTYDEFLRLPPGGHIHPDDRDLRRQSIQEVRAGRQYHLRARDLRKDGSAFDVEVLGTGFMYRGSLHVLAVLRDVTEQVEAERKLERGARMSALAATVGGALTEGRELRSTLQRCAEAIVQQAGFGLARIWTVNDAGDTLELQATAGSFTGEPAERDRRIPVSDERVAAMVSRRVPSITSNFTPHADAPYREWAQREGMTSWAGFPLIVEDEFNGILAVFAREQLAPEVAESMNAIAGAIAVGIRRDHAECEVRNARELLEVRVEERTRELATLLDVSNNVASTLELEPLLQLILEQVHEVAAYDRASVNLHDGDVVRVLAVRSGSDGAQKGLITHVGMEFPVWRGSVIWDTIQSGAPIIIGDITSDEPMAKAYRASLGRSISAEVISYTRSWMAVPLARQDRVIGMLLFSREQPDFYTDRHAQLASAIAAQAAVAIENARLFERAEDRTRELAALLDISAGIASTLELRPLVSVILDQMKTLVDYTGATILMVQGDELAVLETWSPGPGNDGAGNQFSIADADSIWRDIARFEAVIIPDVRADGAQAAAYRRAVGRRIEVPPLSIVRSWMAVPLALNERVIGLLALSRSEPGFFNDQHAKLARAVADQAAVAIENARLYQQATTIAALEERQRLARELHDSVSQALYGIALGARTARTLLDRDPVKAVEPVDYVLQLAEAGLAEMRALIFELRPESLASEGLVAAIEKQTAAMRARYGIDVQAELCPEPAVRIEVLEAVYRIAQESMHNVVKHANASRVDLRLECDDQAIELDVRDDGAGFDAGGEFPGHLGLQSMRERAARLGGTLAIESAPGRGSRVHVRIPV